MSSERRVYDVATVLTFDLGFPTKNSANNVGSLVISGLNGVRSLGVAMTRPIVTGGGGSDTMDIIFQESGDPVIRQQNTYDGVDDGSIKLKEGAATNVALAIPFTQSGDRTAGAGVLWLSKLGTPVRSGATPDPSIYFDIVEDDGGGDPSSTTVLESWHIPTADISAQLTAVLIGGQTWNRDLIDGDDYWLVIRANYDADPLNCIQVHFNTVAGTSGCKTNSGGWSAIANQDIWFQHYQYDFVDVPDSEIVGGALSFAEDVYYVNSVDGLQLRDIDLTERANYMRTRYVISGGTWRPAVLATAGLPVQGPVLGGDLQIF
jgi:hypothetical protein